MLFLFVLILIAVCLIYKIQFSYWTRHKSVASVPGRFLSGNFRDFITFKTNFVYHLKTIYDDPEFAEKPVVGVYGVYKPALLIREPEIIKSILIKDFDSFHDRFDDRDVGYDPIGAQMMFYSSYALWKEMRTKLSPIFTSAKMKYMYNLIQNVAEQMDAYLKKQPKVFKAEMKDFCARYSTDVTATTLLGFQSNSLENPSEELKHEIAQMTAFTAKRGFDFMIILFAPKLARLFGSKLFFPETDRFLRASIPPAIAEREQSRENRNDLIDLLVKLKQEATENGKDMHQFMECLTAQAGIFIAGGAETSSTTMSNVLLELAKHPELQKKLKKQIRNAFEAANGSHISYEAMNKMVYLEMIIDETLRLYPVLSMLQRNYRKPVGKMEQYSLQPYCDFSIPDGMSVFISVYGLHYDSKVRNHTHLSANNSVAFER